MTVTINDPTNFLGRISLSWSSDLGGTPTFYVYVDGALAVSTTDTTYTFHGAAGESYLIEIFDSALDAPDPIPSGRATLSWYPVAGADEYRITRLDSGTWVEHGQVLEDGSAWYTWTSVQLTDGTLYRYRVTAINEDTYLGTAMEASMYVVRVPSPPDVSYAYNGAVAATVTISEA